MNILICDDRREEIDKVEKIITDNCVEDIVLSFTSSKQMCDMLLNERTQIDLFILDIEMPELNGLQVKQLIADLYVDTNIVFLTSHQEVMQEAFGKQVRGFLQKDVDEDLLSMFINEIRSEKNKENRVVIMDGKIQHVFNKKNIVIIQSQHVYSKVTFFSYYNNDTKQAESKSEIFRVSLVEWEKALQDDAFLRIGRKIIVNLAFVKKITNDILLETGESIHIPAKRLKWVKESYNYYCAKESRCVW